MMALSNIECFINNTKSIWFTNLPQFTNFWRTRSLAHSVSVRKPYTNQYFELCEPLKCVKWSEHQKVITLVTFAVLNFSITSLVSLPLSCRVHFALNTLFRTFHIYFDISPIRSFVACPCPSIWNARSLYFLASVASKRRRKFCENQSRTFPDVWNECTLQKQNSSENKKNLCNAREKKNIMRSWIGAFSLLQNVPTDTDGQNAITSFFRSLTQRNKLSFSKQVNNS